MPPAALAGERRRGVVEEEVSDVAGPVEHRQVAAVDEAELLDPVQVADDLLRRAVAGEQEDVGHARIDRS